MDNILDLNLADLRLGGRAAVPFSVGEPSPLTEQDLSRLSEPRDTQAPPIKRLRERHHSLARMLADGQPHGDAAIACGYTPARVSILMGDPAFRELVTHYRERRAERYFDGHQAMAELHKDSVEELRERLEETPEEFTIGHLMELTKLTADRTGLGVSTKSEVDVRVGLADRLTAARQRILEARAATALDVTPSHGVA